MLLSLVDHGQHGYGSIEEVLDCTEGKVRLWPATLYGTLERLVDVDLIEESRCRQAPEHDDARRRYLSAHAVRPACAGSGEPADRGIRVIRSKGGMRTDLVANVLDLSGDQLDEIVSLG